MNPATDRRCLWCGKPRLALAGPWMLAQGEDYGVTYHQACWLEVRSKRLLELARTTAEQLAVLDSIEAISYPF